MVKGVFVLLVFVSHISQYLGASLDLSTENIAFWTQGFTFVRNKLGQFIVVPFLFFSGYGIRIQTESLGTAYIRSFPQKRILRIYGHAILLLASFLVTQLTLGVSFSTRQIVLSALFWENLGNSNWYVFAAILLYCITYLCFRILRKPKHAAIACWLLTLAYCAWISQLKESWWFDSVLSYCYGLSYPTLRRSRLFKLVSRSVSLQIVCLVTGLIAYQFIHAPGNSSPFVSGLYSNLRYIAVMQALILFFRQVQIGNTCLKWLGEHSFEIYMVQRIPMLVLSHFMLQVISVPAFVSACLLATLLLSALYATAFSWLDSHILCIKQVK